MSTSQRHTSLPGSVSSWNTKRATSRKELPLHFQVQAAGGQYTASTHFVIPYVKWGMKNPSNFLLKVDDKVEVDVRAVAVPATS